MVKVGGSMGWAAIGSSSDGSQMVSATVAAARPEIATMSPAWPFLDGLALEAAEGQHLRHPALLDEPPSRARALIA